MTPDDDDAAQLESLIIERAIYHVNEDVGFAGNMMDLAGYDREHNVVTYVVRQLVNLAQRHGLEVEPIDIDRIAKKVSELRSKQETSRRKPNQARQRK